MNLRLASQSRIRRALFQQARIPIQVSAARIDESAVLNSLQAEGASPRDVVDTLAELKARKISHKFPGEIVLGCDQVMVVDNAIHGKPKTQIDLKKTLIQLGQKKHSLFTGNVLYQNGQPLWRHVGLVQMQMVKMSEQEIDAYIDQHWHHAQHNAGGYSFEITPHLFQDVQGSWFDILGMSLPQVLVQLQILGLISPDHEMPKLAAVLGHPIAHSKSPKLHGYWLEKHNIPGNYSAIDLPPKGFEQGAQALAQAGFSGFNVTIPHKAAALKMAKTVSDTAKKIGAANTLFISPIGEIVAHNTDAYGFLENIRSEYPSWTAAEGPAFVLGAGGAARAVLWALLDAGAPKILLTNRTLQKAKDLAQEFGPKVTPISWDQKNQHMDDLNILVNTTSLGMTGQPALEIDLARLSPKTLVNDIVYNPLMTDLLIQAQSKGCRIVDGLGMLLHQAVPGFQGWFDQQVKVDESLRQKVLE